MAYDHHVRKIGPGHYRLSWMVDRKVMGSRLRFPTQTSRDTDKPGAVKFARKWKLAKSEAELIADPEG